MHAPRHLPRLAAATSVVLGVGPLEPRTTPGRARAPAVPPMERSRRPAGLAGPLHGTLVPLGVAACTVLPAASPASRSRRLDGRHLAGHLRHLERAARSLCAADRRGDGDAEDLVQETLERVLRRPRAITGDPVLYLLQALRHTYLDRRRAQRSRVSAVPQAPDFDAPDPRAGEHLALRVEVREVLAAIRDLPRPYREAVLLLDVAGYTSREAAARLGVPQGTLDSRAFRGRARVLAAVAAEDPAPAAATGPAASPSGSHGCRRRPSRSPGR